MYAPRRPRRSAAPSTALRALEALGHDAPLGVLATRGDGEQERRSAAIGAAGIFVRALVRALLALFYSGCEVPVDVREVERRHDIDFAATLAEDLRRLSEHEAAGLVRIAPERIEATPSGELFVRNLALCFVRYWREKLEGQEKPVFSRTV